MNENVVGYYNAGDRMKVWGKSGAFWGGMGGLLFGSAFFFVPGIGPLLIAGPLVTWILAGLESAVVVGSLSALGAALFSIGIPADSILQYETDIRAGKFILIAHGSAAETAHAREILHSAGPESLAEHRKPDAGIAPQNLMSVY